MSSEQDAHQRAPSLQVTGEGGGMLGTEGTGVLGLGTLRAGAGLGLAGLGTLRAGVGLGDEAMGTSAGSGVARPLAA